MDARFKIPNFYIHYFVTSWLNEANPVIYLPKQIQPSRLCPFWCKLVWSRWWNVCLVLLCIVVDFIFISVLETGIWPILNYPEIKKLMTHLLLLLLRSYSTLVQTVLLNLRITWYTCWGGEGDHEGPAIGMPTKSSLYSSLLTHSAGAYPGFHSRSVITSPSMGCY